MEHAAEHLRQVLEYLKRDLRNAIEDIEEFSKRYDKAVEARNRIEKEIKGIQILLKEMHE